MTTAHRRCIAVSLIALCSAVVVARDVTPEYQLKAAFVAKFPEFSEWPAVALASSNTIDICVARPNPFGSALSDFVRNEQVRGRQLRVREISGSADASSCHALFISARAAAQQRELLSATRNTPVLTVGESPTFLDDGGIINLRLVDGRVRFEVNVGAANKVGVRFSSQLLRLALSVRGEPS